MRRIRACFLFARPMRLTLCTQHTNASAQALYVSLGFVRDEAFVYMNLPVR